MSHETAVRQALDGRTLPQDDPRCSQCRAALEGARVVVCTRRVYGNPGWEINAVWCVECGPGAVPETPHGESALAAARVGMLVDVLDRTHEPALLDVTIEDCAFDEVPSRYAADAHTGRDAS